MLKPSFAAFTIFLLLLSFLPLRSEVSAAQIKSSADTIVTMLNQGGTVSAQKFLFDISKFDTNQEATKLAHEIQRSDPNCLGPVRIHEDLILSLSNLTARPSLLRLFNETIATREFLAIMATESQRASACKLKRFKVFFVNGNGVMVNIHLNP